MVLRRRGSSVQKFGFINGVDDVNWPPYKDSKSWRFERFEMSNCSKNFGSTFPNSYRFLYYNQARSVVIFSSTHKYIWSRNLSKLSEKYCVLYFLFEIVVLIQAKNKASCPYFEQTGRKQNIVLVVLAWLELSTTLSERRSFASSPFCCTLTKQHCIV